MRTVLEIHLVCRNDKNVEDLGNGYFKSGNWKIAENSANTAKYLALHEEKNQQSYRQGVIESWERSSEEPERIVFYVKGTNEPMEWKGEGTGEKGYYYED